MTSFRSAEKERQIADQVVSRYRSLLEEVASPLVMSEEIWEECQRQARSAVSDCYRALHSEESKLDYSSDAEFVSLLLGARRALQEVPVAESVRASHLLISAALERLPDMVSDLPDSEIASRLLSGVQVLHQSVGARVRAGFTGYDAFLLEDVGKINVSRRTELARDIHDRIGSNLSLALRCLELHERLDAESAPAAAAPSVANAKNALQAAFAVTRGLVSGLRAAEPSRGLKARLDDFAELARPGDTAVAIVVNGDPSWMSDACAEEVFLVTRECLRNAFTHAKAKRVQVDINVSPRRLQGYVRDDGVGLRTPLPPGQEGNGLASIRERVRQLEGDAVIAGRPGVGTCVRFSVPLTLAGPAFRAAS
ncbi:sensor histidine kinase [Streptomyces sp. NPDC055400]